MGHKIRGVMRQKQNRKQILIYAYGSS